MSLIQHLLSHPASQNFYQVSECPNFTLSLNLFWFSCTLPSLFLLPFLLSVLLFPTAMSPCVDYFSLSLSYRHTELKNATLKLTCQSTVQNQASQGCRFVKSNYFIYIFTTINTLIFKKGNRSVQAVFPHIFQVTMHSKVMFPGARRHRSQQRGVNYIFLQQ